MTDDKLLPTGSERRREYLARKMGELADATRKASKLLPDRPITGEVVACAGIMAMANLLDEVSRVLAASPPEASREPNGWAYTDKHGDVRVSFFLDELGDVERGTAVAFFYAPVPPVEPEGDER